MNCDSDVTEMFGTSLYQTNQLGHCRYGLGLDEPIGTGPIELKNR